MQRGVRHILAQPVTALRQRLGLAVDAPNLLLLAVGQQVMVNLQANLRTNRQLGQAQEHVQRIGHAPVRGILQRHHTEVRVAAIHFLEDGRDAANPHELYLLAETLDSCKMAEAVFGTEVRHLEHFLECPRSTHDFAENSPNGSRIEWAFVRFQHVVENFLFSCWRKDFRSVDVFDFADFARQTGSFVDKFQDLKIEFVHLIAERAK